MTTRSVFDWNTGEPTVFLPLQTAANRRAAAAMVVDKARAAGIEPSVILGISRKSDERAAERRRYSPPVEGAAAGQRAADRRDALRRGSI
ncbi:hypothetical protein [Variovorax ginsengisoli]|uniref:Uncharacterized protein n=1 Tax=Variovorax ginsengisoli TaxID=363844 RepID=A0ABT8SHL0_9BURK|nr:hypothetical protein [Variovorax ginsengisoli]MDN8617836.1 hypothetical protein [Variovorax ginsengisoli]MDO1537006.1 hypothetical protein [Variovorax ginsengisoli]